MANAFSKNEIVFFEQLLEGFDPNNITAKQVMNYKPPSTQFERSSLTVHRPLPYVSTTNEGLTLAEADFSDMTQLSVPSTLNANDATPSDIKNVPFKMNAVELNDPLQRDRKVTSAVQALSALVDNTVATKIALEGTLFIKDTEGGITNYGQVAKCEEAMTIRDVPIMAPRTLIMNPADYNLVAKDLADGRKILTGKGLTAFERSQIPMIATFDSFKASFMPTIFAAAGTGYLVDGVQQHIPLATDGNGKNVDNRYMDLTIDTGTGTIVPGDAFTIAGVNTLSMLHKNDVGTLQTFRVIEVTSSTLIKISPAIVTNDGSPTQSEKEYANCSVAAPDDAAITFLNTVNAPSNIFFAKESVEIINGSLSTMDLDGSGVSTMRESTDSGLDIIFAKGADIRNLGTEYRLTMWFAANVLNEQMCGNLVGKQT